MIGHAVVARGGVLAGKIKYLLDDGAYAAVNEVTQSAGKTALTLAYQA